MHILTLFIWVASVVLLGIAALVGGLKIEWLGVMLFDLWLGLQFLMEITDPITF